MSATPEQILEWAEAYQGHDNAEGRGDNENCKWCRAWSDEDWRKPCPKSPRLKAAALIRAQAERVRVLERLAERIAGEAPFKEPSEGPSVAWSPGWSDDLRDTVNDMIQEAFDNGRSCAYWHLGQIADAALAGAR